MSAISRTIWRRYFERVETDEPDDRGIILPTNIIDDNDNNNNNNNDDDSNVDASLSTSRSRSRSVNTNDTTSIPLGIATAAEENEEEEDNNQQQQQAAGTTTSENEDNDNDNDNNNDQNNEFSSLRELEEARDNALRRSSSTIMLGSYVLMIIWLQAFTTNNIGLFLISVVLTVYFRRYVEEAQERIDILTQMVIDRNDDYTTTTNSSGGVGEIVKQNWDTFQFNSRASLVKKENFGISNNDYKDNDNNHSTLSTIDNADNDDQYEDDDILEEIYNESQQQQLHEHHHEAEEKEEEEEPECSICLGEYEKGDELVSLNPCRHVFHEECISAWTNHNIRCPLCNVDLVNIIERTTEPSLVTTDNMV